MNPIIIQNKAVVERLVEEVWNLKQPQLIETYFSEDFATSTPGGMLYGPEGYSKIYHAYVDAFPDCNLKIADILGENNQIVVRFVFKGTHQGPLMGVQPTGRRISINGISIMRLQAGKITDQQVVWDTLSMMEQLKAITVANT